MEGLITYDSYTFLFEYGKIMTGLHHLKWESNNCRYYFESDGHMIKDSCLIIDGKQLCFNKNGCYSK